MDVRTQNLRASPDRVVSEKTDHHPCYLQQSYHKYQDGGQIRNVYPEYPVGSVQTRAESATEFKRTGHRLQNTVSRQAASSSMNDCTEEHIGKNTNKCYHLEDDLVARLNIYHNQLLQNCSGNIKSQLMQRDHTNNTLFDSVAEYIIDDLFDEMVKEFNECLHHSACGILTNL